MSDLSILFQRIICFSIIPAHNISWALFHHSERTSANFVIFLSRHCLEFCTRAIQYSAEQKPLCTISHFPFPPEIRCCCQPYLQIIFWLQYLWPWTNSNLNSLSHRERSNWWCYISWPSLYNLDSCVFIFDKIVSRLGIFKTWDLLWIRTINNDCKGVHVQNVGEMELCEMIIGENILKAQTDDIIQSDIE